ncbi:hypothetical protein IFM89_026213 [Coptis chinensis]|uniref:XPG-I domain-containing protein n=1 Tax=Coptis chinensis TaxID=261450 RepID=A0A835HBM5_9MAGN|nr:hypothetical protein IFM89_026213 [Coptis chinensis]
MLCFIKVGDEVYAAAAEDMDTLTFGAPLFLCQLSGSSGKVLVVEYEVAKILEELKLTMDQFIDFCILCGCDYCESIRGIGEQTALKLVRRYGSIENIVKNISKVRYLKIGHTKKLEARYLFKESVVSTDDLKAEIEWTTPDEVKTFSFVHKMDYMIPLAPWAIEKIKAAENKYSHGPQW